jgi:hypothetical protein
MSTASAKKAPGHGDGDRLLDETMPMPALSRLLEAGDVRSPPTDLPQTESIGKRLERLIELSESMNSRLDQIAELLARQNQRRKAQSPKKRTRR